MSLTVLFSFSITLHFTSLCIYARRSLRVGGGDCDCTIGGNMKGFMTHSYTTLYMSGLYVCAYIYSIYMYTVYTRSGGLVKDMVKREACRWSMFHRQSVVVSILVFSFYRVSVR